MLLGLQLPHLLSGFAVKRVDVSRGIAEEHGWSARHLPYRDARTHFRENRGGPMDTARGRIESIDGAILRAGEDASAIDSRLGSQHSRVGKRECPFGRKFGYV